MTADSVQFLPPTFFQEMLDLSSNDQLKQKISQVKCHLGALQDHIYGMESEIFELKEEKENFLKNTAKKNKVDSKKNCTFWGEYHDEFNGQYRWYERFRGHLHF